MGVVFSHLLNVIFGLQQKRLLLLGLDSAGKTSILYKLYLKETIQTIPTVGFNVEQIRHKRMEMTIWDMGGGLKLKEIYPRYYINTDAIICVVDSSDVKRVDQAREFLFTALKHENLDPCRTVLILLNKQDLPGAMTPSFMIEKLGVSDASEDNPLKDRNWHVQPCCVISGEGLYEGLDWLSVALQEQENERKAASHNSNT